MIKGFLRAKQNFFNMINIGSIVRHWYYSDSGTCDYSE